jgi:hypothetical protein
VKDYQEILNTFEPITLKEMDSVKLMDRTDTKFVFPFSKLSMILEQVKDDYRVLDVNGHRISRYESLYFDTKNFDLYYHHHRGKTNRFKVRCRKYVESDLHFFEVKFKNNKGRTIKDRVKQPLIDGGINEKAEKLLTEKSPLKASELEAKFWVNYSRITLVNRHSPERVTLDLHLTFVDTKQDKAIHNMVIAEVKQDKATTSAFIRLMKKNRIREGSISKYCFGVISLNENIKHNNFKSKLVQLKKATYDTTARHSE